MRRRPLRSKLCRASGGVCIARFDHFCDWVNRPIGAGNHLLFLSFVGLQVLALLLWVCLGVALLRAGGAGGASLLHPPGSFVLILTAFALLVAASLSVLCLFQLRNVLWNLTTNEALNLSRYPHFWRGARRPDGSRRFSNPFDKGVWGNLVEFLGIGGRVEYVRLFPEGPSHGPGRAAGQRGRGRIRRGAGARAEGKDAEVEEEEEEEVMDVMVVPSGWSWSESDQVQHLLVPPALPFEMCYEM